MAEVEQEIPAAAELHRVAASEMHIPADIQKLPEDIQKLPEETPKKPEIKPEPAEAPAPKRRGRPPGAKNKAPAKPRKVVVPEEPVVQAPVHRVAERVEELHQRPIPTQARDSRETLMLRLLTEQARSRQERKLAKWRRMFV